jgi:hypothetical protein
MPIDCFVYPKDTLIHICNDGNSFEYHLKKELKIHNFLQEKEDFMFKNLCLFEKRIGVEVTDKEIYVLNEQPKDDEYINLGDLIEKNGGLLRIPFLCKS